MTLQKALFFFVIGLLVIGFTTHLFAPADHNSSSSAIASVPADEPVVPADIDSRKIFREIAGRINPGDTLSKSLRRSNVPDNVSSEIIHSLKKSLDLRSLRPGDTFLASLDDNDDLVSFNYVRSPFESYTISQQDGIYLSDRDKIELKVETVALKGEINSSLFNVFLDQGEGGKLVYAFADIFAARIDFNTECRKGDQVDVVFEKYYKDDEFVGYGKIIYAGYHQQSGTDIEGFYYTPAKKSGAYYADDGQELGASFIKSPLPVGRLTSRFTWHRKHPILGVVRPHLGIDLAAPVGTPIMAAGDGKVVFAGRRGGFGRQIILAHANGYKTYYGHLSRFKRGLRKGSRVKQKEIIGYVGSSGMSTGPHLDYRLSQNGVYKNPLAIKFKPKSFLRGEELAAFKRQKQKFLAKIGLSEPRRIVEVRQIIVGPQDDVTRIL